MWQIDSVTPDKCNYNCDNLASCACGLVYGDYKCVCPKGYSGSGYVGECNGKKEFTWLSFLESPYCCKTCFNEKARWEVLKWHRSYLIQDLTEVPEQIWLLNLWIFYKKIINFNGQAFRLHPRRVVFIAKSILYFTLIIFFWHSQLLT